jgi:hypothetical protein
MQRVGIVAAAVLLSIAIAACGRTTSKAVSPNAAASSIAPPDYDPDDGRPTDDDALSAQSFGHEASRPTRAIIARLVTRYMAAAGAENGAEGCTMLIRTLAESLVSSYGLHGPPYLLGGKTCASVLSRIFKHEHRQLAGEARMTDVDGVRVEGDRGLAFIGRGGMPERLIVVLRVEGKWGVAVMEGGPMRKLE